MALTPQEEAGIRERAAIAVAEAEAAKEKAAKSKTQAAANTIPKTSNGAQEKNSARYSQMENTYNELLSNVTSDVKNDIKNGDIVNILKDYDWIVNKAKTEDLLPDKNIHFCHRSGNPHKFPLRYVHHPQGSDDMEKARKVHTSDGLSGTPYIRKH